MMTYSKPKKEMMNKGGLMGLNRTGFRFGSKGPGEIMQDEKKIQQFFENIKIKNAPYGILMPPPKDLDLRNLKTADRPPEPELQIGPYDPDSIINPFSKDNVVEFDDGTFMYKDNGKYFRMDDDDEPYQVPGPIKGAKPIPKTVEAAKGGLMRLNYMIGGEAKQMEAGAPPIMYSGNMDPNAQNQQAGLPAVPGPMQMAEDGPEFDMRENGGFQPLGRQEGKDDVPAMLAKNEFVMTADAVRAAGGGSIQKGAQKMYDTMKKLESRVS